MKSIVITGGASGLGLAMAKKWASTGAHICIADRNDEQAESVIKQINEAGGAGFFCQCDITDDDSVKSLKAFADENLPPVDLLINNAGVPTAGGLMDETLEAWQWVLDINLKGMVRVTQAFLPGMIQRKSGYILNTASQAGLTPAPLMASYNATKAAVVALSETMKLELEQFNIGVSVLCPAFVKTNLDKSLPAGQSAMQKTVSRAIEKATFTPEMIADITFSAIKKNIFMIITHKDGRQIYRIKRFLPSLYFAIMRRKLKAYIAKGYQREPANSH